MRRLVLALILTSSVACHPGQPLVGGVKQPVGGTVSGAVSATDVSVPVVGRKVVLTETTTNAHYDTTTAANGGYTIQVPRGTYRIELELRPGEALQKQPAETSIHISDLDTRRDFVVTLQR
jgi:Carboxypeptidase regulatory-like domain